MAGTASIGMPDLLRAKAISASAGIEKKNTSTILIWLDGGPSHLDTYNMKPEAPAEYRGIWKPIKTNVPAWKSPNSFLGMPQLPTNIR